MYFLELFISNNDYEEIAQQTNLYASQFLNSNDGVLNPSSRFLIWKPTTGQEIKLYLALVIAMGLVTPHYLQEYWTTDPVTSTPFFPSVMPRDRCIILSSFFHLNDNTFYIPRGRDGYDPLFKLGGLYRRILGRFRNVYTPYQQLSFDEGMIPWRGNLSFRIYNPDKPQKWGMKAYMLCDATNGYCCTFQLYTGKSRQPAPSLNGILYDLVMNVLRGFYFQGHRLYIDRYYTSPKLFWDLWILGVGATGTVKKSRRGIPQELKDKKLGTKGEVFVMNNGPLTATKYLDHKDVYILSTTHQSENVLTGKKDPKTGRDIIRPSVIAEYNKYMGGVDRSDQMAAYYKSIGTFKWWKRVFFHVFSLAVLNAYICCKETTRNGPPMLQRVFRKKLVSEMVFSVDVQASSRSTGRPSSLVLERLKGRHFLARIEVGGKISYRRCFVCSKVESEVQDTGAGQKRKRTGRETSYSCKQCNIPLCVIPFFELYHTKQEYVLA